MSTDYGDLFVRDGDTEPVRRGKIPIKNSYSLISCSRGRARARGERVARETMGMIGHRGACGAEEEP